VPKYRYRILEGKIGNEARICIRVNVEQMGGQVIELNVQKDHVHLIVMLAPKYKISDLVGRVKGRSAIRILRMYPELRKQRYWGNHFWAEGYCVDTIGLDAAMILKYVKYQQKKEEDREQLRFKF
jgi:putative transposase